MYFSYFLRNFFNLSKISLPPSSNMVCCLLWDGLLLSDVVFLFLRNGLHHSSDRVFIYLQLQSSAFLRSDLHVSSDKVFILGKSAPVPICGYVLSFILMDDLFSVIYYWHHILWDFASFLSAMVTSFLKYCLHLHPNLVFTYPQIYWPNFLHTVLIFHHVVFTYTQIAVCIFLKCGLHLSKGTHLSFLTYAVHMMTEIVFLFHQIWPTRFLQHTAMVFVFH
jgi:hypothetical protein